MNNQQLPITKRIFFSLFLLCFSILITFIIGEIIIRIFIPTERFWQISNIYSHSDIPSLSYTYRKNYDGIAFGVDLKTNQFGFRGKSWELNKDSNIFRIALIGDSYAFGYGIQSDQAVGPSVVKLLEKYYQRKFELLNFGVNGYNSFQQLASLSYFALNYQPDLVILLPVSNDHEVTRRVDNNGWMHFDGDINNKNSRIFDNSIHLIASNKINSYLLLFLIQSYNQFKVTANNSNELKLLDTNKRWMKPISKTFVHQNLNTSVYQPLQTMIKTIQEKDIPVILAPFAGGPAYRQLLLKLSLDNKVPMIELLSLFPEANSWKKLLEKHSLGWNDHLNASAHARFASAITDLIIKNKFVQ